MALAFSPAGSIDALADYYRCESTVSQEPKDNIYVPPGATCTLNGTRVEGNITVDSNARLFANSVRVDGNIQTVGTAARVNVSPGSFVGGSIQIKQSGAADIRGVDIDSDLLFDDNTGFLDAVDNTIGGNLQVFQNTGGSDHRQQDRRQPAVQGERSSAHRRRKYRRRQHGGAVRQL